jgi:hypothetical protein
MGKVWEDFRGNLPWKDLLLGFLAPKAMLFAGISAHRVFIGAVAAAVWSIAVFWMTLARSKRVNVFAVLAMIAIVARVAVILASRSPVLYIYAQAIESGLYGSVFMLSLLLPRSLIQLFAEGSGVKIPERVKSSAYYRMAWQVITATWGLAYLATAAVLVTFRMVSLKWAAAIDILSNWPVTIGLILFTVTFPRWYWTRKLGDIEALP